MRLGYPILQVVSWQRTDLHGRFGYYQRHAFGVGEWHAMHCSPDAMLRVMTVIVQYMQLEMQEAGCPVESLQWEFQYPILFDDDDTSPPLEAKLISYGELKVRDKVSQPRGRVVLADGAGSTSAERQDNADSSHD